MVQLHPLFTAPADAVDVAMVQSFLDLQIEENLTVEYKSAGDSGALEAAAAMANTYGGLVLYGVQKLPGYADRPGELAGVAPGEKEKLVNKGASGGFDPPWWFPEVISVPIGIDGKVVLILRIDAERAPRPVLYKGSIRIRLNGRTDVADRRLARQLFQESEPPTPGGSQSPKRWPSAYMEPFGSHSSPPDVVVRLVCGQSLRGGPARPSLGGAAYRAIMEVIEAFDVGVSTMLGRGGPIFNQLDDNSFSSRFMRVASGHGLVGGARRPERRMECTFALSGVGRDAELAVCTDALFWIETDPKMRLPAEDMITAAHVLARLLTRRLLPAVATAILGAQLPVPAVELHVEGRPGTNRFGDEEPTSLKDLIILDKFGVPREDRMIVRGSEFLPPDLVDVGDLDGAVSEALRLIVTDWGFPDPKIP